MKLKEILLKEEPKADKKISAADITRQRQAREKEQLKIRQSRELSRAREQDFRAKEAERRSAEQKKMNQQRLTKSESLELEFDFGLNNENIYEYLEDGTLKLVQAYKKATPGEDI